MTDLKALEKTIRALAAVIRKHGTCAPAALDHVADELAAALAAQEAKPAGGEGVVVPRDEAERLVKVLRYAAHPQPSPHGDYLAGLLAAAPQPAKVDATFRRGRYFCDGPNGHFYLNDLRMARSALKFIDPEGDDWTVTDTIPQPGDGEVGR